MTEHVERKLDWKPNHDPRSRNFAAVRGAPSTRKSRTWSLRNPVLDQGSEGACVGHGVINGCSTTEMGIKLPDPQTTAFGMYYGSRYIDDEPGEDYDGTSVNAGCQLAKGLGFAKGYRWDFGVEQVAQTILEDGVVVIGINWYDSMYDTTSAGLVTVSGPLVGGHCICVIGFNRMAKMPGYTGPVFRWRNSWGTSYGLRGDGFIPYASLDRLLQEDGEAAILDPVLP